MRLRPRRVRTRLTLRHRAADRLTRVYVEVLVRFKQLHFNARRDLVESFVRDGEILRHLPSSRVERALWLVPWDVCGYRAPRQRASEVAMKNYFGFAADRGG
jgi:hypothetical protein